MTGCLFDHRWSFPQAQGVRDRQGRFRRTGPDEQACCDCGKRRESPVQFGRATNEVAGELVEVATG